MQKKYIYFFIVTIYFSTILAHATGLKIATYNVRNFGRKGEDSVEKLNQVTKHLKSLNADLFTFEEVVNRDVLLKLITNHFPKYSMIASKCGGGGIQHLAFAYNTSKLKLIKTLETNTVKEKLECNSGARPLFLANFQILKSKKNFWAIAIHLKAGGRPANIDFRHKQLDKLNLFLKTFGDRSLIVLGDFNTTEFIEKGDRYDHFIKTFESLNYKNLSMNKIMCSSYWYGNRDDQTMYPSLLDHIITSPNFNKAFGTSKIQQIGHCKSFSCNLIPEVELPSSYTFGSDHCPMSATFNKF